MMSLMKVEPQFEYIHLLSRRKDVDVLEQLPIAHQPPVALNEKP